MDSLLELGHVIVAKINPAILPWAVLAAALLIIIVWGAKWLITKLVQAMSGTGEGAASVAATLESMESHFTRSISGLKAEVEQMRREARCRHPGSGE